MSDETDCYYCGDGIERSRSGWVHIDDSIGVDGKRVVSTCNQASPNRFP